MEKKSLIKLTTPRIIFTFYSSRYYCLSSFLAVFFFFSYSPWICSLAWFPGWHPVKLILAVACLATNTCKCTSMGLARTYADFRFLFVSDLWKTCFSYVWNGRAPLRLWFSLFFPRDILTTTAEWLKHACPVATALNTRVKTNNNASTTTEYLRGRRDNEICSYTRGMDVYDVIQQCDTMLNCSPLMWGYASWERFDCHTTSLV